MNQKKGKKSKRAKRTSVNFLTILPWMISSDPLLLG
jgi:hypothetical protein